MTGISAQLDQGFRLASKHVRETLARADVSGFWLTVECSGRTQTGESECLIEYKIASNRYNDDMVKGADLDAVLYEFLRRRGWTSVHAPLALAAPCEVTEE